MDKMTVVSKDGAVRYILTDEEVQTPAQCEHKFDAEGKQCVFCLAKKEETNEF
jgi:hypothetical protein